MRTASSIIPFLLLFVRSAIANNALQRQPFAFNRLSLKENLSRKRGCSSPHLLHALEIPSCSRNNHDASLSMTKSSSSLLQTPKVHPESFEKALIIRGGTAMSGKELVTFSQHLAGSTFYFFAIMYGVACALSPLKTARFFYGYDETSKEQKNTAKSGTFLMRMIGAVTGGIGLTAAFAVASELRASGDMPSVSSMNLAIGVGLIPRLVLLVYVLLMTEIPSTLRITSTNAKILVVETIYFMYTMFSGEYFPEMALLMEVAFSLLLGPLFFFKPAVIYNEELMPSRHEKLVIRLLASYTIMRGILLAGLAHPTTNALPAVGFTAMVWVATLFHLTFVRKDVEECGCSVATHIAMMVCGIAVSVGGLHHYFTT